MSTKGILFFCSALFVVLAAFEDFGHFDGDPITKWNADGRTMTVLQDFTYQDAQGQRWIAPAGSVVDGASIPRVFWTLIGGPFEGKYRNASIVHDTECQTPHHHDWRSVHRMFYSACRAGGVGMIKSKILFSAVYHFGPRWVLPSKAAPIPHGPGTRPIPTPRPASWREPAPQAEDMELQTRMDGEDDFIRMELFIRKNPETSLESIENLTHEYLQAQFTPAEVQNERRWLLEKRRERELNKINPDEIEPFSQSR